MNLSAAEIDSSEFVSDEFVDSRSSYQRYYSVVTLKNFDEVSFLTAVGTALLFDPSWPSSSIYATLKSPMSLTNP